MKDLGKVTFKFKLGGGLNSLCVAGALAIGVHSLIKLGDWMVTSNLRKLVKEANGVLDELKKRGVAGEDAFDEWED